MHGAELACQTHVAETVGPQRCMIAGTEEHGQRQQGWSLLCPIFVFENKGFLFKMKKHGRWLQARHITWVSRLCASQRHGATLSVGLMPCNGAILLSLDICLSPVGWVT